MNRGLLAGILITALLAVSVAARGQSGTASLKSSDDSLEATPLSPMGPPAPAGKGATTVVPPGAFDMTRVLLATVGVIGLILLMRAGVRRIFPSAVTHRSSSMVKVLSRCTISPRQHLLVVQFGKRLVLVGDSGSNLNPLCEIRDPDEAANILTHARDESISVARRFDSLFGRAQKDFDEPEESELQEKFDNSNEVSRDDPAVQETQKELADLRDKVKEVARRIGRA